VGSFAVVTAIRNALHPTALPSAAPSAAMIAPQVSTPRDPPPAPPEVTLEELPLPDGLAVVGGHGLLEVDVPGASTLVIDGVEVGDGPIRQIPIVAGSHRIEFTVGGGQIAKTAEVTAGRRTRIAVKSVQ